jgi:multidrug resistance efflux pump
MPASRKSSSVLLVAMVVLIVFAVAASFWLRRHKTPTTPSIKGTPGLILH